jgi:hypothetical protein
MDIYYKSDFTLIETFLDNDGVAIDMTASQSLEEDEFITLRQQIIKHTRIKHNNLK